VQHLASHKGRWKNYDAKYEIRKPIVNARTGVPATVRVAESGKFNTQLARERHRAEIFSQSNLMDNVALACLQVQNVCVFNNIIKH
jgi:hypothetical protein